MKQSRALDWWFGLLMLGLGLILFHPAQQLTQSGLTGRLPETAWAILFTLIGLVRIGSLLLDGYFRSGSTALVRSASATLSALFWSQFLAATWQGSMGATPPRPTWVLWVTLMLVAGELWCATRAGSDFMHIRRAWREADAPTQ